MMEELKLENFTEEMLGLVVKISLENKAFNGKIYAIIEKGEKLGKGAISRYYGTKIMIFRQRLKTHNRQSALKYAETIHASVKVNNFYKRVILRKPDKSFTILVANPEILYKVEIEKNEFNLSEIK